MLILTRREEEAIRIADDIVVRIVGIHGRRVRLGIDAPPHVEIERAELTAAGTIVTGHVTAVNDNSTGETSPNRPPSGERS